MTPAQWKKAKTHLSNADPVLKQIIASYQGEMLTKKGDPFFTLARAIVGQQISVKAADSIWNKLMSQHDDGWHTALFPSLSDETLRACGLSAQKVNYIRSITDYFTTPREFETMSDDELLASLTSIKGVGIWTAEMFMIFHLGRPDVLPLADIGLQKAMFNHYFSGNKVAPEKLRKIATPWQPYRSVATWYLWRSLDPLPVEY